MLTTEQHNANTNISKVHKKSGKNVLIHYILQNQSTQRKHDQHPAMKIKGRCYSNQMI